MVCPNPTVSNGLNLGLHIVDESIVSKPTVISAIVLNSTYMRVAVGFKSFLFHKGIFGGKCALQINVSQPGMVVNIYCGIVVPLSCQPPFELRYENRCA